MEWLWVIGAILGAIWMLSRWRFSLSLWTAIVAAPVAVMTFAGVVPMMVPIFFWAVLLLMVGFGIPSLRRRWVSAPVMEYIHRVLPPMSETEQAAIQAGNAWWESELFRGEPNWNRLRTIPGPRLTREEQAFIDGPVETLCEMLDDWEITHQRRDLPAEVWRFLADHGFFGLIIPRQYGGLGFSALAHSSIVLKVASRSGSTGVTVMVPNSLGPAELLLHYGTDVQRQHYLPRLARGEEIPCFALTSPTAGSDATSITDHGVVCRGEYDGQEVLGLRVSWNKRYITLAPVATVIGLAFKAYDPDHLLGDREQLGITVALIPADTAGVETGRRHYPMDLAFQNGPTTGRDVFVPLEWIIGGRDNIGRGWQMLVESLSVGRGISLPALGAGAGKQAARVTGAYARIRRQFQRPIGQFEGVQEALARIGGIAYSMDAARTLTTSAIDLGERPSVVTALLKHYNTEGMRRVVNAAMDVHGGRGIMTGPNNYLANQYTSVPITITVEGANILTRGMIIFGQGAMRCHPYLASEIEAATRQDLRRFDRALTAHLGYTIRNLARAVTLGVTGGRIEPNLPRGPARRHYQQVTRYSAAFAFLADFALMFLGGTLKRKETLSGRFADALGGLFYATAALKRFEDQGRPVEDRPLLDWSMAWSLHQTETALDGILSNFPSSAVGRLLRFIVLPLGRRQRGPDDHLGHRVAALLLEPSPTRDRLTQGVFVSERPHDRTGRLEHALQLAIATEGLELRLRGAGLPETPDEALEDTLGIARDRGVLTESESQLLLAARNQVAGAVAVDAFEPTANGMSVARESSRRYSPVTWLKSVTQS